MTNIHKDAHSLHPPVKQVYKTLDLIGWYAIGSDVTPAHHAIHAQVGMARRVVLN